MIGEEDGDFVMLVVCFFLGCVFTVWVLLNSLMLKCLRTSRRVLVFGQPRSRVRSQEAPKPPRTGFGKPNA